MLIIKITQSNSQCPICLERFEVGCEAKKMPCDQILRIIHLERSSMEEGKI
uniref:Uncharacterized protein n=1 Tax=Cajanus cajan TaxID=3821 RepID=A0A151TDZ0_CAJCA|nr:hypothetical protein KK1_011494 [Cajanus cajan]